MRFNATRLDQGLIASNLSAVPEPATFVCPDNRPSLTISPSPLDYSASFALTLLCHDTRRDTIRFYAFRYNGRYHAGFLPSIYHS
jgi:hypothetical protein